MTNQEAIEILYSDIDNKSCDGCQILCRGLKCSVNEALNIAIKALEQEPCDDAISRQAVFEQINCWIGSGEYRYTNATHYLTERVKHISPVNTQEPKYCDRNICIKNEYNGIGCNECEVTKSQEPSSSENPNNSQEPKTGHWIITCKSNITGFSMKTCSICNTQALEISKYCPNCGGKLEGEAE